MDEREAQEEWLRYSAEANYRIMQIQTERSRLRLAYVQDLYPNTLPAKVAFQEALAVAGVTFLFLVLPIFGLMWLDQLDGFDDPRSVWLTYAAGLVVLGIVQAARAYQAAKAHYAAIQLTCERFNTEGWPPLTAIEEAAHRDTTPQRLLEIAKSASSDVLIVVGENPNLPPAGLDLLAQHPDPLVRLRAAWHPNTPSGARERLVDDPEEGVRDAARTLS